MLGDCAVGKTSIIQNYISTEIGSFTIPNFVIKVNGKSVSVKGKIIEVDNSYDDPKQYPSGIPYVLVNGDISIDNQVYTGVKSGKAIP